MIYTFKYFAKNINLNLFYYKSQILAESLYHHLQVICFIEPWDASKNNVLVYTLTDQLRHIIVHDLYSSINTIITLEWPDRQHSSDKFSDYRPHPAVNKESVALCGASCILFIHVTGSKNTRTSYLTARLKDDEERGWRIRRRTSRGRASEERERWESDSEDARNNKSR